MNLSVGIVGLPNVGKSTLFNALLKKQAALAANYPFATIEPNVGVVGVPDERLSKLAQVILKISGKLPPLVPATVSFVDIAGLVKGASQGEGLGNKFLSHIREVDAIVQVVRGFTDENVIRAGSENPKSDFEVIQAELILADLEVVVNHMGRKSIDGKKKIYAEKLKSALEQGIPARLVQLTDEESLDARQLNLLTAKPVIMVLNVDEGLAGEVVTTVAGIEFLPISAKMEEELAGLSDEDAALYLKSVGLSEPGLNRLVKLAFTTLGLQTFLTAGEIEVKAWTIKKGTKAPQAAGVIHNDFEKHFIKADVIDWQDFVQYDGWQKAREVGKVRMEGREYVMKADDLVEFKIGN